MHHGLDDATADSMQYSRLDILLFSGNISKHRSVLWCRHKASPSSGQSLYRPAIKRCQLAVQALFKKKRELFSISRHMLHINELTQEIGKISANSGHSTGR